MLVMEARRKSGGFVRKDMNGMPSYIVEHLDEDVLIVLEIKNNYYNTNFYNKYQINTESGHNTLLEVYFPI